MDGPWLVGAGVGADEVGADEVGADEVGAGRSVAVGSVAAGLPMGEANGLDVGAGLPTTFGPGSGTNRFRRPRLRRSR